MESENAKIVEEKLQQAIDKVNEIKQKMDSFQASLIEFIEQREGGAVIQMFSTEKKEQA